jgi:carbonic anhydrase
VSADKALRRLAKGNARMVAAQQTHPNSSKARREELVTGQSPWAIILSCSVRVCRGLCTK